MVEIKTLFEDNSQPQESYNTKIVLRPTYNPAAVGSICNLYIHLSSGTITCETGTVERVGASSYSTVGRSLALFVHLSTKLEHASKRAFSLRHHYPIGLVQTPLVRPLCLPFFLKIFRAVLTIQNQSKGMSSTSQRVVADAMSAEEPIIHSFNQRRRRDLLWKAAA